MSSTDTKSVIPNKSYTKRRSKAVFIDEAKKDGKMEDNYEEEENPVYLSMVNDDFIASDVAANSPEVDYVDFIQGSAKDLFQQPNEDLNTYTYKIQYYLQNLKTRVIKKADAYFEKYGTESDIIWEANNGNGRATNIPVLEALCNTEYAGPLSVEDAIKLVDDAANQLIPGSDNFMRVIYILKAYRFCKTSKLTEYNIETKKIKDNKKGPSGGVKRVIGTNNTVQTIGDLIDLNEYKSITEWKTKKAKLAYNRNNLEYKPGYSWSQIFFGENAKNNEFDIMFQYGGITMADLNCFMVPFINISKGPDPIWRPTKYFYDSHTKKVTLALIPYTDDEKTGMKAQRKAIKLIKKVNTSDVLSADATESEKVGELLKRANERKDEVFKVVKENKK